MSCDEFQAQSAELALGILDGRERAATLAHVEHCPTCRHDLLLAGAVADRLVELTPPAEPPPGFETRVLAALVPERRPHRLHRLHRPHRPHRQPTVIRVLAAAAVAVVLGLGGWAVGHGATDHPATGNAAVAGPQLITADLVSGQDHVGQVILSTGGQPWISMAIDTGLGDRTILCQVRDRHGDTATVGQFTLSNGYGYWAAPLPHLSAPITEAQLVDGGHTVATAAL